MAACAISPRLKINSVHKFSSISVVCSLVHSRARSGSPHQNQFVFAKYSYVFAYIYIQPSHKSQRWCARSSARDRVWARDVWSFSVRIKSHEFTLKCTAIFLLFVFRFIFFSLHSFLVFHLVHRPALALAHRAATAVAAGTVAYPHNRNA